MRPSASSAPGHELIDRIRRNKISTVIAQSIVREIAGRGLQAGSPLPTEQAMAAQYGVGRASIREALRLLESQGLVEIRRGNGGGPVVGTSTSERFGEAMTMHMQVRGASMRHLHESVIYLESLSAERAAIMVRDGSADPRAVEEMVEESRRDLARDAEGRLSSQEYVDSGQRFHILIKDICPNPVLDLVAEAVAHIYSTRTAAGGASRFTQDTRMHLHLDHIRIADAIQRGDPDAARDLMRQHMTTSAAAIFDAFPDLPDEMVDWQ
jgi:GntR family transcriptional repressor for pyruvate dehydrogenase complex